MAQVTIDELKEKFSTVQNISQGLKEEKIRLESELATLEKDYNEHVNELLEKTGAATLDDAMEVYKKKREELDSSMIELEKELNGYLDTYGEEEGDRDEELQ